MANLDNCKTILRKLIADGNLSAVPLAEQAIDEYLQATPPGARKSGLRLLHEDALAQFHTAVRVQRSFAEAVTAYIEKKLAEG